MAALLPSTQCLSLVFRNPGWLGSKGQLHCRAISTLSATPGVLTTGQHTVRRKCFSTQNGVGAKPSVSTDDDKNQRTLKEPEKSKPSIAVAVSPPRASNLQIAAAGGGTFVAMSALTAIDLALGHTLGSDTVILIAPMAATASLIFGAPAAPFSQPRNVIGGHFASAVVGASTYKLLLAFPALKPLGAALASSGAVGIMMLSKCLHPPSAATALLGVLGPEWVRDCGFQYAIHSSAGATVLVAVGVLVNNKIHSQKYPIYWW